MTPEEEASFRELAAALHFLKGSARSRTAVLVGGWAVYAMAPYLFSRDIDLVVRKRERRKLVRWLEERGYERAGTAQDETARADSSMALRATPGFTLYIDLASTVEEMGEEDETQMEEDDL